jgi:pyrimidine operon attenuation protein/uracil phosphoribosyltransferase
LCYQLIENHDDFSQSVVVGLQPRGVMLSRRIISELNRLTGQKVTYGELDVTFFRDDFRRKALIPQNTQMDFVVEGKKVILIDDVLFTGRSIRAGLDALQQLPGAGKAGRRCHFSDSHESEPARAEQTCCLG